MCMTACVKPAYLLISLTLFHYKKNVNVCYTTTESRGKKKTWQLVMSIIVSVNNPRITQEMELPKKITLLKFLICEITASFVKKGPFWLRRCIRVKFLHLLLFTCYFPSSLAAKSCTLTPRTDHKDQSLSYMHCSSPTHNLLLKIGHPIFMTKTRLICLGKKRLKQ